MKKKQALIYFAAVMFFISGITFSQSSKNVKAIVGELPESVAPGSLSQVAVNITNNGKQQWSSEHLHGKALGKFDFSRTWSNWILQPGETIQVYYNLTAPNTAGTYNVTVILYNDKKPIGKDSRKIKVIDNEGAK